MGGSQSQRTPPPSYKQSLRGTRLPVTTSAVGRCVSVPLALSLQVQRLTAPDDFLLHSIPHAKGLVEAAATSGHPEVLAHVLANYQARYPHCFSWQYHEGHGLWQDYPPAAEVQVPTWPPPRP